jgi:CHASE3 domain sensor protein
LEIGRRLGAGFALVLALVVLTAAIGVARLQGVGEATRALAERSLVKERLASAWQLATSTNSVRTFSLLKSDDADVQAYLQKNITATSAVITETQKKLEDMLASPEEQALSADIKKKRGAYVELRNQILKLKAEGKRDDAAKLTDTQLLGALDAYDASIRAMVAQQQQDIDKTAADIEAQYRSGRIYLVGLTAFALVIGSVVAWAAHAQHRRPDRRGAADRRDRGRRRPEPGIRDRARRRLRPAAARHGRDGRHAHRPGDAHQGLHRLDRGGLAADRGGQRRPVFAHRAAGQLAGGDGCFDGGTHFHRQAERRQRTPGQPAGRVGLRPWR